MATVYLAQDLRHDRKVALKVLRPDLAAVIGADRFLQKIRTTANLQPIDGSASRWQISRNGGDRPAWSRSGRELFFYSDDSIRVAGLGRGAGFQASEPRPLFLLENFPGFAGFDVLPGDSLLVLSANGSGARERIMVIANFLTELGALTGSPSGRDRPR